MPAGAFAGRAEPLPNPTWQHFDQKAIYDLGSGTVIDTAGTGGLNGEAKALHFSEHGLRQLACAVHRTDSG